jgi:KDO2-lipid IV(A) lauroyltransferase
MLAWLSSLIAWLPLSKVHSIGALIGKLSLRTNRVLNEIAEANIKQSGLCQNQQEVQLLLNSSRVETGKSVLESFYLWGSELDKILPLVKTVHGWSLVESALASGKGLIFVTPHLGCFEITSLYYAAHHPITVLYRPPKKHWLTPLVEHGRKKGLVTLAPANATGVKKLLQALKRGEAIGILPDQIPRQGEGEWADFFGKPAYTMSLASKLASKTNAVTVMAFGERLPDGKGFDIHLKQVDDISTPTLLNQAIEQQIAQCPEQYLWQYNRFKQRRFAMHKLEQQSATAKSDQPD